MELYINNKHKKIDLSKLILEKNKVRVATFGLSMLMIFSGSAMPVKASTNDNSTSISSELDIDYTNISDNTIVDIPDNYKYLVTTACSKEEDDTITVGDLRNIKGSLKLRCVDNSSMEWLNYCDNLENLEIVLHVDNIEMFNNIKLLKSLKALSLLNYEQNIALALTEENFSFLKSKNLNKLTISGMDIPKDFIENLSNLKSLEIFPFVYDNIDIDFSKLTFLDELHFGCGPYDVAINLNTEEYNLLTSNGVSIVSNDVNNNNLENINARLDSIVNSLGVDKNSSDQEKLDAILVYVIENLSYDEMYYNVSNDNENNDLDLKDLNQEFYEGGFLYGALEKNAVICGNYAALVSALSDRLDLDTYFITSHDHAWNLVSVEGINYYVDATGIDNSNRIELKEYDEYGNVTKVTYSSNSNDIASVIKEGRGKELIWYMEDPTLYYDAAHEATDIPSFVKITPIDTEMIDNSNKENFVEEIDNNEEKVEDITNKKFKIEIGSRTFIICGGALVGIMMGLGLASVAKNKRKKVSNQQKTNLNSPKLDYNSFDAYSDSNSFDFFSDSNYRKR